RIARGVLSASWKTDSLVCCSVRDSLRSLFLFRFLSGSLTSRRPEPGLPHHIYPCGCSVDGNVSLCIDGHLCRHWLGIQCASRVDDGFVALNNRRDVYLLVPGDGIVVGQANLGNVVGMGCSHHIDFDLVVSLYWVHLPAISNRRSKTCGSSRRCA